MRAVVIDRFDGPQGVRVTDMPDPTPGPGQVLVRVEAAGLNPVDAFAVSGARPLGWSPPAVLAWDAAGTVEALGEGVDEFRVGQPVVGFSDQLRTGHGVAAELVALDLIAVAARTGGLDAVHGATLPANALAAQQALDLQGGERLLVIGATGQVGGFAVQLATYRGIEVVAPVAPDDVEAVLALGVQQTVDRGPDGPAQVRALIPDGVDAVLQAGGTREDGETALVALRDGGRFVTVLVGREPRAQRGIAVSSVQVELDGVQLRELAVLMGEGVLTPRVAATYPFARAAEALAHVTAGGLRGKLVLVP
jgi:NADPH2:quinone reductase